MADSNPTTQTPTSTNAEAPKTNGETTKSAASQKGQTANSAPTELSNAEKKKQQKAEKAARRAKQKTETGEVDGANAAAGDSSTQAQDQQRQKNGQSEAKAKHTEQDGGKIQHRRSGSTTSKPDKPLPVRQRRPSQNQPPAKEQKQTSKQVSMFAHLYGQPRRTSLEGVSKEIHPAVLALGLQLSTYVICGSHARGVAMLIALKAVIQSYTTPHGTSLPRHLSSHALSPQLSHLKSSRAFSVSQSNSIRWLKNLIANIDPSASEATAKSDLLSAIDAFIRERFTLSSAAIASSAAARISPADVVLVHAKSASVQHALLAAHQSGTPFSVLVADAPPLHEGRNLASALAAAGIPVSYVPTTALASQVRGVTKCLLGAHAVLGNGAVYSRVGTALVALAAASRRIPVLVCAESIKFTERVALDAIVMNELAPEEELVGASWQEAEGPQVLNVLYDVTPPEYIDTVITELGAFPPSSAPMIQRISSGA